ncbi:Aste57867_15246 [Aphanomyces stellatus]|uniref:Aste57867_15246 protein n=1 Tax=Aphanomyces stellatus TaxID=120398 RepID=A0A485L3N5_9STRA|nr:hypothetical protein As57867_015190 [Aphanomyces stellatus]VFT92055.1 Aste57867_15246 [Aphanomyces stellatus]
MSISPRMDACGGAASLGIAQVHLNVLATAHINSTIGMPIFRCIPRASSACVAAHACGKAMFSSRVDPRMALHALKHLSLSSLAPVFDLRCTMHIDTTAFASVILFLSAPLLVDGHGALLDPIPTWINPTSDTSTFCGEIYGPTVLPGDSYNTSPNANTRSFTKHFQASTYKTLKELIVANPSTCGQCGITSSSGTPQKLNADGTIHWDHDGQGFLNTHEGPCEVWCDNTRVFQNDDCALNVPNGLMKIDAAKCQGAKQLVVYWLALHVSQWQIYLNCVTLADSASATPPVSTSPSPATSTPPSATPYPIAPATTPPPMVTPSPSTSNAGPSVAPLTTAAAPTTAPPPSPAMTQTPPTTVSFSFTPPPSYPTTPSPMPPINLARGYNQCGGDNYHGPTQCVAGFNCQVINSHYSQCIQVPGVLETYQQCGGVGYTGISTCKTGNVCYILNDYFSQCLPQ